MSVEAMWTVEFVGLPGQEANFGAGVLVLETQRAFGGDSYMYYVGSYKVNGSQISIEVAVGYHNPAGESVFGPQFRSFTLQGIGTVSSDHTVIEWDASMQGHPQNKLKARFRRLAELPG